MNNRFNNTDNNSADYSGQKYFDRYLVGEALSSEEKLFLDAYDFARQSKTASIYQLELKEMIERLYIEMLFLTAIYGYYQSNGYYQSIGGNHHFKIRPHAWLSAAERSEQRLSKQWHKRLNETGLNDWSNKGFAGHLITEAKHNLGRPVWAWTRFAPVCQAGNLGCAATVSELLQDAGVKIAGSASVYGLVDQLSQLGWQRIKISDKSQFHEGDIVFGLKGSHGHIGIISQVTDDQVMVCDNSSSTGTLKERTIESGGSFTPSGRFAGNLYVMRQS